MRYRESRFCVGCGKLFTPKGRSRHYEDGQQRYCTRECAGLYAPESNANAENRARSAICEVCGGEFTWRATRSNGRTCSWECAKWIVSGGPRRGLGKTCPVPWRNCKDCGAPYCSGGCNGSCLRCSQLRKLANLLRVIRQQLPPLGVCRLCGQPVEPWPFRGHLCHSYHEDCMREVRRHAKHKRRCLVGSEGSSNPISLQVLGDRDGWVCHICSGPVRKESGNDSKAPSIDHLRPVSKGGAHTWENVALAHKGCNSGRGNRSVLIQAKVIEGSAKAPCC